MYFQFIQPEQYNCDKKCRYPASYIRKEFTVQPGLCKAVLHMTALGIYHPTVNGEKITQRLLLPGYTNYHRRVQYQSFDITVFLTAGENAIGCVLTDGWYRGCVGAYGTHNVYGDKLALGAVLELRYPGKTVRLQTDESWMATQNGPLRENDLKLLERYDAKKEMAGWDCPGFNDTGWHTCTVTSYSGKVIPDEGEPVLRQERFAPRVLHTPDGNCILDFGQNIAGIVEFTVKGKAGHTAGLIMGETLDEAGNFTLKNLQGDDKGEGLIALGQKLEYTLKDGLQTYAPYTLISGFRYCKLLDWPEEVKAENFTAYAVYSDLAFAGDFACSNSLINKLVENVRWSMKSNFVDIPTDCPQRERAGWAGDINVFIETANYLADTRKFIGKWMGDFVAAQKSDGSLPYIIPEIPVLGAGSSSSGWADAISTLPLAQYETYGNLAEVEKAYPAVKKFVDFNTARARKRHITHLLRREPHYNYILDTGFHYGEWLEPGGSNIKDALKAILLPDAEVATAWFYYTCANLVKMAELLEKQEDAETYRELAEKIKAAYRTEFLKNGEVDPQRQCRYVRPIYMGLAEEAEIPKLAKGLNELCVANGYRIGTGFLTTYRILQVLTDHGYGETAYKMLENEQCPGWLYEVKQGATTVWEGWDAIEPETGKLKPLSQNHYAPGAAISWLFSHCAGIRPTKAGYQEVRIQPVPGGSLTWAKANVMTVRGQIRCGWRIEGDRFVLDVQLPVSVNATVILPDGSILKNAESGTYACAYTM